MLLQTVCFHFNLKIVSFILLHIILFSLLLYTKYYTFFFFIFTVVLHLLKEAYQKIFIGCFKDNDNFFQLDLEPNFWLVELCEAGNVFQLLSVTDDWLHTSRCLLFFSFLFILNFPLLYIRILDVEMKLVWK